MKGFKIRIFPTIEQEVLLRKSIGCYRYVYNWGLALNSQTYKETNKGLSYVDLGKLLTAHKKEEDFKWLNEVAAHSLKEALRDLSKAYTNFFEGRAKYPKFKSKRKAKLKYYCRYDKLYFTEEGTVNIEKIGKVKYQADIKNIDLTTVKKFSNPRVEFVNGKWILSFSIAEISEKISKDLTDVSLGIDLGVKMLAYCSDTSLNAININKTAEVKRLKKKLKRLQRQCSRKYEMNKEGNKFIKTNNIIKLEKRIRKIYTRLNNIRNNHLHQSTTKLVKSKPYRIVIEDLNVSGMLKNKHLAKVIQEQCFNRFRTLLTYKCEKYGIELVVADRWFPSSKTCSNCKKPKVDLKLSDRTFRCEHCGATINRDENAAINLSNYGLV